MLSDMPSTPDPTSAPAATRIFALALALAAAGCSAQAEDASATRGTHALAASLRDGDIIFQTSRSAQSLAIQRATGSRYSHMGVIFLRDGEPFVFEASARVQRTPLQTWIARGQGGHYVIKRLQDADMRLTPRALARARELARSFEGKRYDLTFEWSDRRMYCSELVYKLYERAAGVRIGRLQRLRDFALDDPVVRRKLKERYGERVPLDEPVISPASMYESPLLVEIARR